MGELQRPISGTRGFSMDELSSAIHGKFNRGSRIQCWEWTGHTLSTGYGQLTLQKDKRRIRWRAHRLAYLVFNGSLPDGALILHSCHNRACVNPDHLRPGTHADNMREMAEAGRHAMNRRTHCSRGHHFDHANTGLGPNGRLRNCRACRRENVAAKRGRDPEYEYLKSKRTCPECSHGASMHKFNGKGPGGTVRWKCVDPSGCECTSKHTDCVGDPAIRGVRAVRAARSAREGE